MENDKQEFYFDIKARQNNDTNNDSWNKWTWPPIWSGKINAIDRKDARKLIELEYNRKFIMRDGVKVKTEPFLLSIKPMTSYLEKRFELKTCEICKQEFTLNDKYIADDNINHEVCSDKCHDEFKISQEIANQGNYGINNYLNPPVIYKITDKRDLSKCYIGKSIRSFTLRWWEHIKQGKAYSENGNNKLYSAIKDSKLNDWIYEVIEIIIYTESIKTQNDKDRYILERETYWMQYYNSINNGYNSVESKKTVKEDKTQMKLGI